jgi:hypothetical protein
VQSSSDEEEAAMEDEGEDDGVSTAQLCYGFPVTMGNLKETILLGRRWYKVSTALRDHHSDEMVQ